MMMNVKAEHHPAILHARDIIEICKPLLALKINYFSHVIIDRNNTFSGLSNHPNFAEHYLKKKYYNADIHLAQNFMNGYILWDAIENSGETEKLNIDAISFGVDHTFTIIEQIGDDKHYYHFGSNLIGKSINQIYLNHIDLLHLFIAKFKDILQFNKKITACYEYKFHLDIQPGFQFNSPYDLNDIDYLRNAYLREFNLNKSGLVFNNIKLSRREIEILFWLHLGKRVADIAAILNLAEITISKHISNIKLKTNCFNNFQLGQLFYQYFEKDTIRNLGRSFE